MTNKAATRSMFGGVRQKDTSALAAALDAGADIAAFNKNKLTALHLAVHLKKLDAVKLLVARGADVNAKDYRGRGPLVAVYHVYGTEPQRFLMKKSAEREIILFLVESGADPNEPYGNRDGVIHRAVASGDHELLEEILRRKGDPRLAGGKGDRPIHLAVNRADERMVERLIAAGADITDRDGAEWNDVENGRNVLHLVIQRLALIERGGSTKMRAPALRLLEMFVQRGVDQTVRTHGATPALLAVRFDLMPALERLTFVDDDAIHLAERENRAEMLAHLKARSFLTR